MAVVMFIMT